MIGSILMIFPFIWTILTSFKTQGEAIMIPPIFFPSHWNFDSYKEVLRTLPFDALYLNTLVLIFWRVVCASVFSSMAGYAFAKLDFPLKKPLLLHHSDPADAAGTGVHHSPIPDAVLHESAEYDALP